MLNEKLNKDKQMNTKNKVKPAKSTIMRNYSATDGIDHINIDSKCGKTELGRLLANFSKTVFKHPDYGPFSSIEGFWHWIRSESHPNALRGMFGEKARTYGRKLNNAVFVDNFKEEIIKAIYFKVVQNSEIYDLLIESTLPFKYYYIFGPKKIEIDPDYSEWLCDGITQIRDHLKQNGKDVPFKYK